MIWSREKLYLEVWQSPMTRLAASVGVTSARLKQICVNADIPLPPLGYWNKIAAGKPVPDRPPLGPSKKNVERVQFLPPNRPSEEAIPHTHREAIASEVSSASVASVLRKPHPLIARLRDDVDFRLQHIGTVSNGSMAEVVCVRQLTATDQRRLRILDALFKQLLQRGWEIKLAATRHFAAVYDGGQIAFRLNERLRQEFVDNPPPTDELYRRLWQPKHQVFHRTGRLAFEITTYGIGPRSRWEDATAIRIEDCFPEIVAAFLLGRLIKQKEEQSREARANRIAEATQRREAARIETEREMARWNALIEAATNRRQAEVVRSFIDDLAARIHEGSKPIEGKPASEWLEWARKCVEDLDPLKDGAIAAIQRIVAKG